MTTPVLYEQSDFVSPDETIQEYRHRCHPAVEHACRAFIAVGFAAAFLLALAAFGSLAVFS